MFGGGLNRVSWYRPPKIRRSSDTEPWTCCPLTPSHCTGVASILNGKKTDQAVSCFIILHKKQKQSVQDQKTRPTRRHKTDSSTLPPPGLTDAVVADAAVRGAWRAEHLAGVAVLELHHVLVYDHFHRTGRRAVRGGTHAVCKEKGGQSGWCR